VLLILWEQHTVDPLDLPVWTWVNDQSETTGNLGDYIPAWAKRDHLIFVGSKEKKKNNNKKSAKSWL